MKIRIWIENENGEMVKNLGTCICDSVGRALQMYEDDLSIDAPERLMYEVLHDHHLYVLPQGQVGLRPAD